MLVLTRRPEEAIIIGNSIRLTVLEIKGNKIRIGIEAPPNVRIHRSELLTRGAFDFHVVDGGDFDIDLPAGEGLVEPMSCI
ncbi:MAG: carbon storage regulator [Planctomycetaceae bacterium]|nr:carbon storage regulator [Planctomycetaceae bacterium]